ncbi:glycoside hydrolase family 88 protein [Chitinophaga horti]|uniref:Glycoside hydrolase family 88 protein n=1 Tax=Chitinophaga horti TaxID=2920382 RepID=A0ABY6IXG8_9BACT|nr:glycoside hydrolase family 88 protein [Chitinophaga horti]UYQ92085.1 glycoside hydrolase family 88 protein [Chitinophaga horti]
MKPLLCLLAAASLLAFTADRKEKQFVSDNFTYAQQQLKNMLKETEKRDPLAFPRTTDKEGKMTTTNMYDWTPGFFPGSLWYAYEATKDPQLLQEATKWTEKLEPLKDFTKHHDLGFMVYCSYGNAYRITGNATYRDILVQSARSLSTRFNPVTGSIKSWNAFKSWHGEQMYYYPVIVDNMMNLELLFFASKVSGDTSFRHVAITHAETAMKNQVRPDYSSYHVVCYDTTNGNVLARETAQGFADNSTWARGQAWAIYGFTMVYRETKDKRFLKTAEGMADWFLDNKNLPADMVPYWDFNMHQQGYTPGVRSNANKVKEPYRDASSAAIVASALFELSEYVDKAKSEKFRKAGVKMLHSLAGPAYRAPKGTNGNFMLMHSVGSIPHGGEIDVPLVYADYYFLEALSRYRKLL